MSLRRRKEEDDQERKRNPMMIPRLRYYWLAVFLMLGSSSSSNFVTAQEGGQPFGYQTGRSVGDSYVGSLSFDSEHQLLYMTGSTYSSYFGSAGGLSDCFIAVARIPPGPFGSIPEWVFTETFGTARPEACTAIQNVGDKTFLVGNAEEGGFMTDLRQKGSDRSTVYGFVLETRFDLDAAISSGGEPQVSLPGGVLIHREPVQYPVALTADKGNNLYVALLETDNDDQNKNYVTVDTPDLSKVQPRGNDFTVKFTKYGQLENIESNGDLQVTLMEEWTQDYGTSDQADVHISSLLHVNGIDTDWLVFAGHTQGSGTAFGPGGASADTDGFVTKLQPSDGKLPTLAQNSKATVRIESSPGANEIVASICSAPIDLVTDIFVVGSTTGVLDQDIQVTGTSYQAFLLRLDIRTLEILWAKQIDAVKGGTDASVDIFGESCAVSPDGLHVYMGGTVKKEGVVNYPSITKSNGGDDIFVAQFDVGDGAITYVQQIGSDKDDNLTTGNGITCDKDGNAIIIGNTLGALMRPRRNAQDNNRDIFFMSVSRENGKYKLPGGHVPSGPISNPTIAPALPPVADAVPTGPAVGDTAPSTSQSSRDASSSSLDEILTAILLVGLFAAAFTLGCTAVRRYRQYDEDRYFGSYPDSAHIARYLQDFEDIDVELKHSATGGWHGMYDYSGEKRMHDISLSDESAPLNKVQRQKSTIIQDSLFMDDFDIPALGLQESLEDSMKNQYNGLVDAYNSTWEDRSSLHLAGPKKTPSTITPPERQSSKKSTDSLEYSLTTAGDGSSAASAGGGGEGRGRWGKEIV